MGVVDVATANNDGTVKVYKVYVQAVHLEAAVKVQTMLVL